MAVRNESATILDCLRSILSQTFENFEIIIIDDFSTDDTEEQIQKLNDKRIKCFKNEKWLGIYPSRNTGIAKASGEYVFFTDGDCTVKKNWIEVGLKSFADSNCVGVEGIIYYVSKDYKRTLSDYYMDNRSGGQFMTGNIAYKKSILERVGGFDEKMTYLGDRDIGFRIMKHGKIYFNPKMIVYHPQVIMTPKKLIKSAKRIKNWVHLYKRNRRECMLWRIVFPLNLAKIIFPPLVFISLISNRLKTSAPALKTSDDLRLLPFVYVFLVAQRLHLWAECAKEKVLLI